MNTQSIIEDYKNLTVDIANKIVENIKTELLYVTDAVLATSSDQYSWDTIIEPFVEVSDRNALKLSILQMSSFHQNEEIRKACTDAETEITKFQISQNMRKDLYNVYKTYYEGKFLEESQNMSEERKKFVNDEMTDYKLNGLNLDCEKYERVKQIKMDLSELCNKVQLNMSNDKTSYVMNGNDLLGMEQSYLEARKSKDLEDTYNITLQYPDFLPIMEYCTVRETRKLVASGFSNRCVDVNMESVLEIFKLRKEMSNILGYSQYSDYGLSKKMAKDTETVMTFLNKLRENMVEPCKNDIQLLKNLAVEMNDNIELELHDIPYYSRIYKEKYTQLDELELKKHFPLDVVTKGMFEIYQTLLGLQFNDVTNVHCDKLWHGEVKIFEVVDKVTLKVIGHFMLDLFPRDGKYGHAAVFPFVTKSKRTLPLASMVCNFDKGGNLTFNDVETYFHEFGHVMHGICSDTELSCFGGTNCERDFVEAPSQMLEEWCYRPVSLKMMSVNMTDEIINKINAKRNMLQGYFNSRQICFGIYDMTLHSNLFDELIMLNGNPIENFAKLHDDIVFGATGIHAIENTNMIASFGHMFGGYVAGYYGYMWSKVYSKDMFITKFRDHELDPNVGMQYRNEILKYGGSRSSQESLKIFLGREPNDEAFVKSFDNNK